MTTVNDQLWDFGEVLSHLIEMDDAAFRAALAEGFQHNRPPYLENRSNEQWAAALLQWLSSLIPMVQERIDLPVEHTRAVIELRNLAVIFDTETMA